MLPVLPEFLQRAIRKITVDLSLTDALVDLVSELHGCRHPSRLAARLVAAGA